jgi:hypothetical protein
MAVQRGNNSSVTNQSGSAVSGSAVGGQVTGVVSGSGGNVNLRRTNSSSGQTLSTNPVTVRNTNRSTTTSRGSSSSGGTSSGGSSSGGAGGSSGGSGGGSTGGSKPPVTIVDVGRFARRRGRPSFRGPSSRYSRKERRR